MLKLRTRMFREHRAAMLLLSRTCFIILAISATNAEFFDLLPSNQDDKALFLETGPSASAAMSEKTLVVGAQKVMDDASGAVDTEEHDIESTLTGSPNDNIMDKFFFAEGKISSKNGAKLGRHSDGEGGIASQQGEAKPDVTISRFKRQSSACGGTLIDTGIIRSPNYPGTYYNNLNCVWTLQTTVPEMGLLVQIRRISTEACCDFIRISNTSGVQLSLSGEQPQRNVTIRSPATIAFTTDVSVTGAGFEIAFSTTCGGTLFGSGIIRSPNYPGTYSNNLNCVWTLETTSPGGGLLIQIRRVSTEACCDFIRISNTSEVQLSLSGEQPQRNITLRSPATIAFTTDHSVMGSGFEIAFSTVCGGTLVGSGTVRSPNFPGSYENNLNCSWTLQATSPNSQLLLLIGRVSTEARHDVIRISNTSGIQLSLSGELSPQRITIGSPATISFTTDASVVATGFELAFSTISSDCGGTINGSGTIRSPNYPGNYPDNVNCLWRLQAATASDTMSLQIRRLSTEPCCDFLRISNSSGLQLSFSGEVESQLITLGSSATVSFTSDHSVTRLGFEIEVVTVHLSPDCGGTIIGSGIVRSPNYPGSYPNNLNCLWRLQAGNASEELTIIIRRVSTEACCDFMRISNDSGVQLSFSGEVGSRTIHLGTRATVSFISDGSVSGRGFEIEVQSFRRYNDCGGTIIGSGIIRSPNFPETYPIYLNCLWRLQSASASEVIALRIQRLTTEACCDFVRIFNASGEQLSFSGVLGPREFTLGTTASVSFTTDGSVSAAGFEIEFSSVPRSIGENVSCGGLVRSPAVITSPGFPQPYPVDRECRWTIQAVSDNNSVLLEFGNLSMTEFDDYLIISDGSEFQYTFTGEVQPHDLLLRPPVEIIFVASNWLPNVNYTGFNVTIRHVPGRAPRICRSGHWVMHGDLCMSVLWYIPLVSWTEGRSLCRSMGGLLVEPDDDEKLQTIGEFLAFHAARTREVWIGLKRGLGEDGWMWDTGRSLTFSSWATGKPHEDASSPSCAALDMEAVSGAWIDDECDAPKAPMCTLLRRNDDLLCQTE